MPILRVDVPLRATESEMADLKTALQDCIERTWAREHIWIAVRSMQSGANESVVILTLDVRHGRGNEKKRTRALFNEALLVCNRIFGTTAKELVLLVRKFEQDECLSGGQYLPSLKQLTPKLTNI